LVYAITIFGLSPAGFVGTMLWAVFILLFSVWLVAFVTAHTFGGFIHLLLVIALTVLLAQIINRRRLV